MSFLEGGEQREVQRPPTPIKKPFVTSDSCFGHNKRAFVKVLIDFFIALLE